MITTSPTTILPTTKRHRLNKISLASAAVALSATLAACCNCDTATQGQQPGDNATSTESAYSGTTFTPNPTSFYAFSGGSVMMKEIAQANFNGEDNLCATISLSNDSSLVALPVKASDWHVILPDGSTQEVTPNPNVPNPFVEGELPVNEIPYQGKDYNLCVPMAKQPGTYGFIYTAPSTGEKFAWNQTFN